jgi:hypothetical protein
MAAKNLTFGVAVVLCVAFVALIALAARGACAGFGTAPRPQHYLVAPYFDLDAIGGRGSPYALTR